MEFSEGDVWLGAGPSAHDVTTDAETGNPSAVLTALCLIARCVPLFGTPWTVAYQARLGRGQDGTAALGAEVCPLLPLGEGARGCRSTLMTSCQVCPSSTSPAHPILP